MSAPYEFTVDDGAKLAVKIQAGRLDVTTGPPGRLRVEVSARDPEWIDVTQTGDVVTVADNRSGWVVRGNVRISVEVPPGCDLDVRSASAPVDVDGEVGSLTCRTASGNVSFDKAAEVDVKTASGAVRGRFVSGGAQVTSAAGEIRIERIGRGVSVGVASGNVSLDDASGDLRVSSASGHVRIDHFRGDEAKVKTVSGHITVGLPTGISLDADLTTLTGSVRLPDAAPSTGGDGGSRRSVRLAAKSVSGNIRISTFTD